MRRLLNTLYVTTQGAYLRKEGESVVVQIEKEERLRVPLLNLQGIICFGNVLCSPFLLGHCAKLQVAVSMLSEHGRYLGAFRGPTSGNVLLRPEQYRRCDDAAKTSVIVRSIVAGKVANARQVLLRAHRDNGPSQALEDAAIHLRGTLKRLQDEKLPADSARGMEGDAARTYFGVFNELITQQGDAFVFKGRSRRPPMDRVNAMLSFAYTLLYHDVTGAVESVGMDPAVGFLHRDRPGRHGMALDLMEELRCFWADRLVLSIINRRQIGERDFDIAATGAVLMNEKGRKALLTAWQKRKQDEITHPFLDEKIPLGLLPSVQARLMARYIRGDTDAYPPFFCK